MQLEDSIEGKICFDIPCAWAGQVVKDVYLEFKKEKENKSDPHWDLIKDLRK